jgi:hypothetical protein
MRAVPPKIEFPPGWKLDRDLVVLYGRNSRGLAHSFRNAGQQRILCYDPAEDVDAQQEPALASPIELVAAIQTLPGEDPERLVIIPAPPDRIPEELAPVLRQAATDALASRATHRVSLDRRGPILARQALANLAQVARNPSIDVLRGALTGVPCVIVSPGPSLSRNLHELKGLRGRAILCTSTHALPALEKAGIRPDIVVVTDSLPLDWQYGSYDFRQVPALVLNASAHPDLFALPARRLFTCTTSPAVDGWIHEGLPGDPCLPSGGTVAGAEFSLALDLGCNPVIFVGQDLALTGGRYYAASVLDGGSTLRIAEDGKSFSLQRRMQHPGALASLADEDGLLENHPESLREVPGWYGEKVPTSQSFYHFRAWIGARALSVEAGRRLYNCTEGGAWIDGTKHLPLAAVLERELETTFELEARMEEAARRWNTIQAAETMRARLERETVELDEVLELAGRCDRLAARARRDARALDALGSGEKELSAKLARLPFLSLAGQEEIRRASEAGARARDLEENLAAARALFAVIAKAARDLKPFLRAAQEDLGRSQSTRASIS